MKNQLFTIILFLFKETNNRKQLKSPPNVYIIIFVHTK